MERDKIVHDLAVAMVTKRSDGSNVDEYVRAYLDLLPQIQAAYDKVVGAPEPSKVNTFKRKF